ncbi:glycosyltransferase family 9 protein [Candidatus Latescibacterota bacterium]
MSISEFIKKKIKSIRYGQPGQMAETPAVNMTNVLTNPKNILILPYNRMGTILLSSRVLKAIREHYPLAKITVAVYEPWSVLISKDPTIDRVIAFGDDIDNPASKGFQVIGQTLAKQKFDLAFYLSYQYDPIMAYLLRLSEADLRVSFKSEEESHYFNVEIIPGNKARYEVDRYLEMLRTIGIEGSIRDYTLKIGDSIRTKARRRYLPGYQDKTKSKYIGFDITREISGEPINKKNVEYIIKTLVSTFKAPVIVFFEPEKKPIAAELKETFGKQIILVEDRPISIAAGLMSFCRFIVTHNTDLFQLAIALKIPSISILTGSEIIQWSPGENEYLIHLERSDSYWPSSDKIVKSAKQIIQQTS